MVSNNALDIMWHIFPDVSWSGLFKGKIIYSHSYKKPVGFENKNVVVVGIWNFDGDAVVELPVSTWCS